jgi:hypothetical protein
MISITAAKRYGLPALAAGVLLVLLIGIGHLLFSFALGTRRTHRELRQELYVWQRNWDEDLSQALERASGQSAGFTALAAEVSWEGDRARVVRVPIDYDAVKAAAVPVGLALRIGPYGGPFAEAEPVTGLLRDIAVSLVRDARRAGITPMELQLDFDCPESKLGGYRQWVETIRKAIKPVPLRITVLPCWLKRDSFRRLARASDGFVLQVHSLERPAGADAPITLTDPAAACRWVEQAARVGVPFRVALPTYGYLVAFDKDGRFVGLSAEGPSQSWPRSASLGAVRADALEMAKLLRHWQEETPAHLQGVIWYRLPVEGDRLNWRWKTLSTVMSGTVPREKLEVRIEYPEPELAEILLLNAGEADLVPIDRVDIEWGGGDFVAADGLRGFAVATTGSSGLSLQRDRDDALSVISPGDQWKVGWLRFKEQTEVEAHVKAFDP